MQPTKEPGLNPYDFCQDPLQASGRLPRVRLSSTLIRVNGTRREARHVAMLCLRETLLSPEQENEPRKYREGDGKLWAVESRLGRSF